jgi:transketolase
MSRVVEAAELLKQRGIKPRVVSMHTLKPLDEDAVLRAARETGGIITVEEHNKYGGLGGAVSEVLAENSLGIPYAKIALNDTYIHEVGSHQWLLDKHGFSPDSIAATCLSLIDK